METSIKPDWCYIGIDHTSNWKIREQLAIYVERILTIFAFNRAVYTNCCELTPSHWLQAVAYGVQTKPETPDEIMEELAALTSTVPLSESDCYMHVTAVIALCAAAPHYFAQFTGTLDDDNNTPEMPERVQEYWNANPKF